MEAPLPEPHSPEREPFRRYLELRERISERATDLAERYSSRLRCRRGCSFCCEEITVLPIEIESVRLWLERLTPPRPDQDGSREGNPDGSAGRRNDASAPEPRRSVDRSAHGVFPVSGRASRCAFLDRDGACTVYGARPIICRTHGLPLSYRIYEYDWKGREVNPERPEYTDLWCDLNFTELDEASAAAFFDGHGRINMDAINRELETLNEAFLRTSAGRRYAGGDERLPLGVLRAATRRIPGGSASP